MFTSEEQPLLTGADDDVSEFVNSDRCMVVDWRGTEDETIDDLIRFLPDGSLTYETTCPGNNTVAIRLRFRDREDSISLPFQPKNNFRVLLRVCHLLQPDYDIKLFRCTAGGDTHGFLLRPTEWWTAYRAAYPQQYQKVFQDVSDLKRLWGLDKAHPNGIMTRLWRWFCKDVCFVVLLSIVRLFTRKRPKKKRINDA
jgi:hypothetical protein